MSDDKVTEIILNDLKEMKRDIKKLLEFRAKLYGMVSIVTILISAGTSYLVKMLPVLP